LQWEDGMVPHNMAKRLITIVADTEEDDDNKILVYVKGSQNCE